MTTHRSYRGMLWTLAILGFAADLGSKYAVFHWMGTKSEYEREHVVVPGAFKLIAQFKTDEANQPVPIETGNWRETLQAWNGPSMPRVNHGALFGLGNSGATTSNGMFMLISVIAAAIIGIWSIRGTATGDRILCAALGLILGGTLGNLFDRAVFHGVRDFLYFHWFEWPVFNVADCCLVCGAALLLIQALWPAKAKQTTDATKREMAAVR